MVRRIGHFYNYWLHEAPLVTKALTAASLFGTGDRMAQHVEAKPAQETEEDHGGLMSASSFRTLRMMI
ncbi:hypothetical protein GN958_ATG21685 [Phytophthora infestans]|uniref:Uncharacterized protein n=1 Tax=Phytophthora infestans TaxID=4787 RepID=A0A8S9TKX3_PHYIN|nr:hypothetical protein GN958_ATG21685 [Phytophthora infestans]